MLRVEATRATRAAAELDVPRDARDVVVPASRRERRRVRGVCAVRGEERHRVGEAEAVGVVVVGERERPLRAHPEADADAAELDDVAVARGTRGGSGVGSGVRLGLVARWSSRGGDGGDDAEDAEVVLRGVRAEREHRRRRRAMTTALFRRRRRASSARVARRASRDVAMPRRRREGAAARGRRRRRRHRDDDGRCPASGGSARARRPVVFATASQHRGRPTLLDRTRTLGVFARVAPAPARHCDSRGCRASTTPRAMAPPKLRARPAVPKDAHEIREFVDTCVRPPARLVSARPPDLGVKRTQSTSKCDDDDVVVVVVAADRSVLFASARSYRSRAAPRPPRAPFADLPRRARPVSSFLSPSLPLVFARHQRDAAPAVRPLRPRAPHRERVDVPRRDRRVLPGVFFREETPHRRAARRHEGRPRAVRRHRAERHGAPQVGGGRGG